jgi:DNA replication protein DnaC
VVTLDALLPRLRQRKLSGMQAAIAARTPEARTPEARTPEARTRSRDPLEFRQLLRDDELARRAAASVARRLQRARFEEVCDLRDFDFTYNPELPKAHLWELASGRFLEE